MSYLNCCCVAVLQFSTPQSLNILYALCPLRYAILSEEGNYLDIKKEVNL